MNKENRYTFAERAMLQHAYLPKLALDCFGMIGSGVLLWQKTYAVRTGCAYRLFAAGNCCGVEARYQQVGRNTIGQLDALPGQADKSRCTYIGSRDIGVGPLASLRASHCRRCCDHFPRSIFEQEIIDTKPDKIVRSRELFAPRAQFEVSRRSKRSSAWNPIQGGSALWI